MLNEVDRMLEALNIEEDSPPLSIEEHAELWKLFLAIHETWGSDAVRVEDMASSWREFIHQKTSTSPSYLDEYRSACELMAESREQHGETLYQYLLLDPMTRSDPASKLGRMKVFVVDEFIRVYVISGGFRTYGGTNYGGFISGSRYRSLPPYRAYEVE